MHRLYALSDSQVQWDRLFSLFNPYVVLNRTLKRSKDNITKINMLFTIEVIL